MALDKRLMPFRADLAAAHLKGTVDAPRFVEGAPASIGVGRAALRAQPSDAAAQDSELLFGEAVTVYERKDGWAWVQALEDGYVGYVRAAALAAPAHPDARISVLSAPLFGGPDLKMPVRDLLPLNAVIQRGSLAGDYIDTGHGYVHHRHLVPLDERSTDFVAVAERFLGVPYVWGGKTFAGLDCSGLIQTSLAAAGTSFPRDTDMQAREVETNVDKGQVRRGDLVFWKGHVGVMLDASRMLHANAFHMQVAAEPLDEAIARIESPVTAIKRL